MGSCRRRDTGLSDPGAAYTYVAAPTITKIVLPAGPIDGGNVVNIVGNNLAAVNMVAFGDRTVAPTTATDTTVTVTVPALLGLPQDQSVSVTLYVPLGSVAFADAYQYLLPPVFRAVDPVVPVVGRPAGDEQVVLHGFHFFHASEVIFGATSVTDLLVSADGRTITLRTPAHGEGRVNLTVKTPGGEITLPDGFEYVTYLAIRPCIRPGRGRPPREPGGRPSFWETGCSVFRPWSGGRACFGAQDSASSASSLTGPGMWPRHPRQWCRRRDSPLEQRQAGAPPVLSAR